MVFGSARLIGYIADSRATRRANAELQALHETPVNTEAPAETPAPMPTPNEMPAPTATPRPTLRSEYQYIGASALPEMSELLNKNADTVGWVRIPGVVNLPVVYRDNSYYLTHDFSGKRNNAGALFLDAAHPMAARTQHLNSVNI